MSSTIRQESSLTFTLPSEVMNVMHFNNQLCVSDSEENMIAINGVEPSELMYLFRNLLCARKDSYDPRSSGNTAIVKELKEYFTNLEID